MGKGNKERDKCFRFVDFTSGLYFTSDYVNRLASGVQDYPMPRARRSSGNVSATHSRRDTQLRGSQRVGGVGVGERQGPCLGSSR